MNGDKITFFCTDSLVPFPTEQKIDIELGCGYKGNISLNQVSANIIQYKGEHFTIFTGKCPFCGRIVEVSSSEIPEEKQEELTNLVKVKKR